MGGPRIHKRELVKNGTFEVPILNVGVKVFIVEAFNEAILDFSRSSECQK